MQIPSLPPGVTLTTLDNGLVIIVRGSPFMEQLLPNHRVKNDFMTIELPDVNIGSQPLTSEQARIELACALMRRGRYQCRKP